MKRLEAWPMSGKPLGSRAEKSVIGDSNRVPTQCG
jgi:hypothetical protein